MLNQIYIIFFVHKLNIHLLFQKECSPLYPCLHIRKLFQLKLHWSRFHMLYAPKNLDSELSEVESCILECNNSTILQHSLVISKITQAE